MKPYEGLYVAIGYVYDFCRSIYMWSLDVFMENVDNFQAMIREFMELTSNNKFFEKPFEKIGFLRTETKKVV